MVWALTLFMLWFKYMKTSLVIVSLIFILTQVLAIKSYASEPESLYLDQFESPNKLVFESIRKGFGSFQEQRPYKLEWKVIIDEKKGIIETNWFPEHKGEVKLKVQIAVWGSIYRVDVWQQTGFLKAPYKTIWSMHFERNLQNEIEKYRQSKDNGM
jgi:hypothetical protein